LAKWFLLVKMDFCYKCKVTNQSTLKIFALNYLDRKGWTYIRLRWVIDDWVCIGPLSWCVVLLILSSLGPFLPTRKIKKINHFIFSMFKVWVHVFISIFWCCINSKLPKRDLGVKVCPWKNEKKFKSSFFKIWQNFD